MLFKPTTAIALISMPMASILMGGWPSFNGSLDPLNGSFTVMNLVRTVYVQWQVPDGSGGLTWTPVDAITAWSTCAAHFTRYQILPTPTATTINWRTDRRAAPALLEVWIDGQLYKHLSTDDGDQISQSVQLPALCSSGSHIAEMIVINSRGAWASSERLASAKREVIAPGASDPAICIG
jgi:hypothetical protein